MKKKQRLITMLLAMMAMLTVTQVKAENYGVYIAGKQITSSNYSKLADIDGVYVSTGGRIYFDSSSNTLYLRNVNINKKDEIGLRNEECYGLKVVFEEYYDSEGINKGCWIQSTNKEAVVLKSSTTFTSTGSGHGIFNSYRSADLSINYYGSIDIQATDICCQGNNIGINGNDKGKLNVYNSLLSVWGGNGIPAVKDLTSLRITGSSNVTLRGNNSTQTVSGLADFILDEDMAISSPSGASFSDGTFKKNGSAITGDIEIKTTAVRINSTNFPDGNFLSYVSTEFDTDKDGYLIKKEISNAKIVYVFEKNISNLKGIEHLTNLGSLICVGNNLSSIDVSKNTSLVSFSCDDNKLTSLNLSNNKMLKRLTCSKNVNLSSLNLLNNTALTYLDCHGNKSLTSLNLSNNSALEELICKNCSKLTSITMGTHSSLKKVDLSSDNMTDQNIDYSLNKYIVGKLPTMLNGVFYTSLFISKGDVLSAINKGWTLNTIGMEVYELNSTNFPDTNFRTYLSNSSCMEMGWVAVETPVTMTLTGKGIKNLTGIGLFTNLQYLYCGNNQLTSLDVSNNKKLKELVCSSNNLSSLNIKGCSQLITVNCNNNNLSTLTLNTNTALENILCSGNNLTELTVKQREKLKVLDCSHNKISRLELTNDDMLNSVDCSYNQITYLRLPTNNTSLKTVHCEGNQLNGLNMNLTINSLPTPSGTKGNFYFSTSTSSEGNALTKLQLANIQRNNWSVWQKSTTGGWEPYVVGSIATNLNEVTSDKLQVTSNEWFTIDGQKLNGKPAKKGIYIQNGKQQIVK